MVSMMNRYPRRAAPLSRAVNKSNKKKGKEPTDEESTMGTIVTIVTKVFRRRDCDRLKRTAKNSWRRAYCKGGQEFVSDAHFIHARCNVANL